jgi:formylmethanofuran dehydrogenase subunit E
MFDVKETAISIPERAQLFDSYICEECGETVGANWVRIAGGKKLCLDCAPKYDRFKV